eukprot:365321-Chlamydomonas_euryale.AAC.1
MRACENVAPNGKARAAPAVTGCVQHAMAGLDLARGREGRAMIAYVCQSRIKLAVWRGSATPAAPGQDS